MRIRAACLVALLASNSSDLARAQTGKAETGSAASFVQRCVTNGLDARGENEESCRDIIRGFAVSMLMSDEMERNYVCEPLQRDILKHPQKADDQLFSWMRANVGQCTSEARDCIDRAMVAAYGCKRHKLPKG